MKSLRKALGAIIISSPQTKQNQYTMATGFQTTKPTIEFCEILHIYCLETSSESHEVQVISALPLSTSVYSPSYLLYLL